MEDKSIYTAGKGEIFTKHFLAGFARGLGGFAVTLVSWIILYFAVVYILLPQLQKPLDQISSLIKLLPKPASTTQSGSPTTGGTQITIPENLLKQIQGNK